ncbi:MAG: DUF2177 family protein [Pseudobdellovibrionaceae bacterium]
MLFKSEALMLRSFLISLPLVLVGDFIWLGFVMRDFNLRQLAHIGRIEDGNFQLMYLPAIAAYLLMAASLALFSIPRAEAASSGLEAFAWGAALGLFIYGIFDMTNLAILKDYPWRFAVVDMAWGTFLYGLVTWAVGWLFAR